jgi:L-ascorbate metabolism protein UlaG (beta-lactamase superfamily)
VRNPYYQGPASDHFDGSRFFMAGHSCDKSFRDLLRWRSSGRRAAWPARFDSPFADVPPQRSESLRVVLIGHASFLLQVAGLNILVDPVWSDRASPLRFAGPRRVNQPGVAFDSLPPIDVVLLTHNHYDHLDLTTLARLWPRFRPRVLAPLGNAAILASAAPEVVSLDWGDGVALSERVSVHLRKALHWSARGLRDRRMALWGAFVLTTPTGVVYHVGDSAYGDGAHFSAVRREFGPPILAALPIGAYAPRWFMATQHMNPAEAVQAWRDCGAAQALGHHWGTFQLTDEPIEAPVGALSAALQVVGAPAASFLAMRPGQVWTPASP